MLERKICRDLKLTYKLDAHFLRGHPLLNHNTHICNKEVKDFQKFLAEMDFAVREIAIFQILPLVLFPCSLAQRCVMSRHPVQPLI